MRTARFVLVPVVLGLLALVSTIPVSASSPAARGPRSPVTITDNVDFSTGLGSFTATGIDGCTTGISFTELTIITPERGRLNFDVVKVFVCDSGGDFALHILAAIPANPNVCASQDTGDWFVLGGDSPYAGLTGSGTVIGTQVFGNGDCTATGVVDHYRGVISITNT